MDFGKEEIRDEDTKVISKQAFWILDFDDGFRIAIRASGTEPKMKCYLFYRDYHRPIDESKERAEKTCGEFMDAIRVEINGRMGN
jgi:phosphomannomutase